MRDFNNKYVHLTNTSINKLGPNCTIEKEGIGAGCKWTIKQLKEWMLNNYDAEMFENLWKSIENIIILTLVSIAPSVPDTNVSFELFGFDIILDSHFKPWLLEVNSSPALSIDCDIDVDVKTCLLRDLINTLDFLNPTQYKNLVFAYWKKREYIFRRQAVTRSGLQIQRDLPYFPQFQQHPRRVPTMNLDKKPSGMQRPLTAQSTKSSQKNLLRTSSQATSTRNSNRTPSHIEEESKSPMNPDWLYNLSQEVQDQVIQKLTLLKENQVRNGFICIFPRTSMDELMLERMIDCKDDINFNQISQQCVKTIVDQIKGLKINKVPELVKGGRHGRTYVS